MADITVALTEISYRVEEAGGSVEICVTILSGAVAVDFDTADIMSVTVTVAAADSPVPDVPASSENYLIRLPVVMFPVLIWRK